MSNIENLQLIITLVASIVTAGVLIYTNIIKNPAIYFKKKRDKEHKDFLIENYETVLGDKIKAQKEEVFREWSDRVYKEVTLNLEQVFEKILKIDKKQEESINNLSYGFLNMIRQNIIFTYYRFKETKQIPFYVKESVDEAYDCYTKLGGNKYISTLYERMNKWDIIETDD